MHSPGSALPDAITVPSLGTAEPEQLPFFIAACDYTLIGEELYAADAYLSKKPALLGSLKGQDWMKIAIALVVVTGVISVSFGFAAEFFSRILSAK